MSRNRYRFDTDLRRPHFLTCTIVAWLPVFTRQEAVQIILDSWSFLQDARRIELFGYVILENHLHWIAAADDLSHEVACFKSFTARKLLDLLELRGAHVLLEQLRYVEFQPYWNVPRGILMQEILPQLRRRPSYLREHDMDVIGQRDRVLGDVPTPVLLQGLVRGELRLRQRPGPRNPLGQVKFVFPNTADVYLHGTPDTALFVRERRDFSHGCIRVQRPTQLAAWVLADQPSWPSDSVEAAAAGKVTRRALLSRPIPVVLFYATAVALPDLGMAFYEDIYGHDRRLDEALRAGPTPP